MNNLTPFSQATPESVWAEFQEIQRYLKELHAENDRYLKEKFAETDRQMKETDRRMKELQKTLGGMANSHGSFAEEYFFNSFEDNEQNFFGEHFDEIEKNVKGRLKNLKDEYDIVLYNGISVAIIEVKYKAHKGDVDKVLKKAETFRILFPDYKDFNIYLGLASMAFYPELEQECINQGIAIIKQVGDNVIINDTHLRAF